MFAFLIMICAQGGLCNTQIIEAPTARLCEAKRTAQQRQYIGRREVMISRCVPVTED